VVLVDDVRYQEREGRDSRTAGSSRISSAKLRVRFVWALRRRQAFPRFLS
jgi:hypothetical protein